MTELDLSQQTRLLARLQDAARFDHPVTGFELIETHISFVLLTGPYAYKIKKAVNFGFLDYSSLAKRHQQCQEELRLNRRTAPQLYLEVVAIGGPVSDPQPGASTGIIEYAVKMRQFDQAALFSRLLAQGRLDAELIERLAQQVADFHQRIATVDADTEFGTPATVWHFVAENFRQIREQNIAAGISGRLDRIEDWSRNRFEKLKPLMQQRRTDGLVRDCHGDLHLNNIVLLDGQPVLFDCIEFNPALRCIDIVSEIAFLVMDLEEHQQAGLANLCLNRWLMETGDYAGLRLLRFYQCYRAMVRAKVAALRLAQTPAASPEHQQAQQAVQDYLELAHRYTRPGKPCLLITHGLSGCGKTWFSRRLLQQLPLIHLRSDVERKRLFGLRPMERSDSAVAGGIYTPDATARTYDHLAELSDLLLASGFAVIVDATFLDPAQRHHFRQLAAQHDVPFRILSLEAEPAVLRARIRQRAREARDASEADLAVLEHQLAHYTPLEAEELPFTLRIDSQHPPPLAELAEQLCR
jgi:aminoglycoside phosphotransferase family enzyme/predicted kinase